MNEKRSKPYTINLTEGEAVKLENLAKQDRRKVAEYLYLIVSDTLAKINN